MLGAEEVKLIVIDYLKYRNYSPLTINHHLLTLNRFSRFLRENQKSGDFRDVREADLFSFLEYCKERSKRGLGKQGQNGYIGSLKGIFKILVLEEKVLFNPFGDVPYIKTVSKIRDKILTEEEIHGLLEGCGESTLTEIRDKAVLSLLYGTGIRANELFNLEIQDFIKDEKFLFIRQGKGKKDRVVPLGERGFLTLGYYIEKVRPKLLEKKRVKYLFVKKNLKKLDHDALEVILKNVEKRSGTKKSIRAHMLRHTFSTHLLNNGADIREVQLLLGHSDLKATEVYLNFTTKHLKDIYVKYHPLENELYFDVYGRENYIFKDDFPAGIELLGKKNLIKD